MTLPSQDDRTLKELISAIVADGKLSRAELKQLDRALLADGKLSPEEREHVAHLLDRIASGELLVVD